MTPDDDTTQQADAPTSAAGATTPAAAPPAGDSPDTAQDSPSPASPGPIAITAWSPGDDVIEVKRSPAPGAARGTWRTFRETVRGLIGLATRQDPAGGHTGSRWRRRSATDRAVGRSLTAAALVTLAAGGDNLAVYIPLFRQGGASKLSAVALVFVAGEVGVTAAILAAGRHPRARGVMTRLGAVAVPLLLCGVGVLVLLTAGTLSWL